VGVGKELMGRFSDGIFYSLELAEREGLDGLRPVAYATALRASCSLRSPNRSNPLTPRWYCRSAEWSGMAETEGFEPPVPFFMFLSVSLRGS